MELHRQILRPLLLGREVTFQGRQVYLHNARFQNGARDSEARQTGAQTFLNATRVSQAWHHKSPWQMVPLAQMLSHLDRISFVGLDQPEKTHFDAGKHSLSKALRRGLGLNSDASVPEWDTLVLGEGECQLFDISAPIFTRTSANVEVGGALSSDDAPPADLGEPVVRLKPMQSHYLFLVEGPRGARAMGVHALIQELQGAYVRNMASDAARGLLIDAIRKLPSRRERLTCLLHLHVAIRFSGQEESRKAYGLEALEAARHLEHGNVQDTLDVLLPRESSWHPQWADRPVVIQVLFAYITALESASGQQPSGSAVSRPTGGDIGTGGWPTEATLRHIEAMLALPIPNRLEVERDRLSRWVREQRSGAHAPAQ